MTNNSTTVESIISTLKSDITLLDKINPFLKEWKNTTEVLSELSKHYDNTSVSYKHSMFKINGTVSQLWVDYKWVENEHNKTKTLILKNPRLITFSWDLARIGIPKSTVYTLIKKGEVNYEKYQINYKKTAYAIHTLSLLNPLIKTLEKALIRSAKGKETSKKRSLALLRSYELGVNYTLKLADNEYYNTLKSNLIKKAIEFRKRTDELDEFNKLLSYLIILNRYAKENYELYTIKEKILKKLIENDKTKAVYLLDAYPDYYKLYEVEFKYNGYLTTHKEGVCAFHIPYPKVLNDEEFKKKLDNLIVKTFDRDNCNYGRIPNFIEYHAFPLKEVINYLTQFIQQH